MTTGLYWLLVFVPTTLLIYACGGVWRLARRRLSNELRAMILDTTRDPNPQLINELRTIRDLLVDIRHKLYDKNEPSLEERMPDLKVIAQESAEPKT